MLLIGFELTSKVSTKLDASPYTNPHMQLESNILLFIELKSNVQHLNGENDSSTTSLKPDQSLDKIFSFSCENVKVKSWASFFGMVSQAEIRKSRELNALRPELHFLTQGNTHSDLTRLPFPLKYILSLYPPRIYYDIQPTSSWFVWSAVRMIKNPHCTDVFIQHTSIAFFTLLLLWHSLEKPWSFLQDPLVPHAILHGSANSKNFLWQYSQ